ncbi:DUF1642 domain-containing protein [Streptococcus pasteurianus]
MNKQEAIEEIKDEIKRNGKRSGSLDYLNGKRDGLVDALKIFKQIDEPEKPTVPQFIDTWIQGAKYNGFDLYEAMTDETKTDDEIPDKVATWIVCNSEAFAKAWLYGYEVEKKKLYTVELPNPNEYNGGNIVLVKKENGICIDCYYNNYYKKLDRAHLTEAEIKKDFDWAWQFAEEV